MHQIVHKESLVTCLSCFSFISGSVIYVSAVRGVCYIYKICRYWNFKLKVIAVDKNIWRILVYIASLIFIWKSSAFSCILDQTRLCVVYTFVCILSYPFDWRALCSLSKVALKYCSVCLWCLSLSSIFCIQLETTRGSFWVWAEPMRDDVAM